MKKLRHKSIPFILAAFLALASLALPLSRTFCTPSGTARFAGTDVTLNIGDTYSIGWAIAASENILLEATFEVPSGLTVTAPIACAQGINGGTSQNKVLDYSGNFAAFHGNITVRADRAGEFRVRMSEVTMISAADSSSATISSGVFTVYVRTQEQTDQSRAAQESIRKEQEEAASRQQSEAASRAASISASASEEERRRKEREDAEYREWLSRSEIEASESAREASISASESEREASISASESEEESRKAASESEEERRRPTELGHLTYVRYYYGPDEDEDGEGDEAFYFATPDNDLPWPDDTHQITMRLNQVNILALKQDGMSSSTYLVYGMKEATDAPAWYYWHRGAGQFFRYDYLHVDASYGEPSTEEASSTTRPGENDSSSPVATNAPKTNEANTGTTLPPKDTTRKLSLKDVLTLVLSGVLGGAAITSLIFLLVLKGRKKEEEPETLEDTAKEAAPEEIEKPEGPREKTGDTDAVDLD